MVKVVTPAATSTTPEMINIFFNFMGRRYPPPSPTSYVERAAEVPGLTFLLFVFRPGGCPNKFPSRPLAGSSATGVAGKAWWQISLGGRRWKSVLVPQNTGYLHPPSSGR